MKKNQKFRKFAARAVEKEKTDKKRQNTGNRGRKVSEYGKQLFEKQKVKGIYGVLEKQFRRFFSMARKTDGNPGENLLSFMERRLDNVLYRLKLASTRLQARQIVVHGHVLINGKKVYSPSCLVSIDDEISFAENVTKKDKFLEQVVDKRLNIGIKVPSWLELKKASRSGKVLRLPIRDDIQMPIEEHLIVELYSK